MATDAGHLVLVIRDADLDDATRAAAKAEKRGSRMLDSEAADVVVSDGLIKAVLRRVTSLAPAGLTLSEIEIGLKIEGKILGSGVTGDVKAKFAPVLLKMP
jgi:hypothetical protein